MQNSTQAVQLIHTNTCMQNIQIHFRPTSPSRHTRTPDSDIHVTALYTGARLHLHLTLLHSRCMNRKIS